MSSLAYLVCSIAVFYLDHVLILSFLMFFGHPVALASRQETMTFFFKASLANSAVTIAHSWEGFKKNLEHLFFRSCQASSMSFMILVYIFFKAVQSCVFPQLRF